MTSVSCASAGNCTAVGRYYDPSVFAHGVLLTQTAGSWATGVEAALPAGGTSIPDSGVASVSCASAGNCTAVGPYYDSSGTTHGLLLTQTAGSWATGVEAALPAGASATDPEAGAGSVSCTSAGNCTASGGYYDSSGSSQGMLLNQTWGSWAMGLKVPLPAGARPIPDAAMTGVSCASAANCTAVGVYYDSSGAQGLLVTQTAPPTDHQLCYLAAAAGPGITLPPPGSVTLKDQFGTFKPTLSRAGQHCNPVKKIMPGGHVSPITNPSAHLLCWKITTGTTKQPPVTVSNQFGAATLSLGNASQLCLPTWKSLTAPPHKTPSQPPGLSHYTCYPVQQVTSGGYKAAQPKLQDEFAAHPVQVSVTFKPAQLCVPTTKTVVTKTGTKVYNIVTGAAELLCFPVSQTPRKTPVYDQDQFTGPGVPMTIERTLTLCLPST
jgi:hypothetical protein